MEVTVEKVETGGVKQSYDAYTVYVGDHRILTVSTYCSFTAIKWINEVQKNHRNKDGPLLIGVSIDSQRFDFGGDDTILLLCTGSHCLLYHLPFAGSIQNLKSLQSFFADPKITAVGLDMVAVTTKLKEENEIEFSSYVDLRNIAVRGPRGERVDVAQFDVDRFAEVVLGRNKCVVRSKKPVKWLKSESERFDWCDPGPELSEDMVKYATVDAYYCFLIGNVMYEMDGTISRCSSKKKKKNKRN